MKGFAEVVEIPETKKDEKYIFGTIKNNGDSSYVTFDGSDFLTPITSAMGYEDGDRVMVMVKSHRAIVVNNMTSPAVTGKYVKENYASFENLSATNAQIGYLRANMITADVLEAKIGEFGYLKADQADLKFATIENLNASNAEISTLKATTIKTDNLAAEVAKLGYAEITDLNAATGRIDTLESTMITADNLRTEIAKLGYLTANQADIRYLTASTADTKFLHADMSDMDIAKIQTLFATAGIVSDMTIKDGHITGELSGIKVSANDISAGRLDAATIEVVNLNAANITVGTINGTQIATGAIDLTKLGSDVTDKLADTEDDVAKAVADAKKAIADSATAQSTADNANSSAVNAINIANGISIGGRNLWLKTKDYDASAYTGWVDNNFGDRGQTSAPHTTVNGFGVQRIAFDWRDISQRVTIEPNTLYTLSAWIKWESSVGTMYFFTNTGSMDGTNVSSQVGTDDYKRVSVTFNSGDATISTCRFECNSNTPYLIYGLKLEKGNKATDWTPAPEDVDSSINTASIKNWCYNGNLAWMNGAKIYANTIVSDAIATDAITAVKIKAGAITADKLAANAVTAGTIAAGSITTDKISANAVSADKIAANAVTADKILGKSITASKISAGTITSDEIAAGTIKAANINVTDLVGNSAFINSLKSNTVIVGLQNDINGISVGGRNLLIGASKYRKSSPVKTGASADDYLYLTGNVSAYLEQGKTYTLQAMTDVSWGTHPSTGKATIWLTKEGSYHRCFDVNGMSGSNSWTFVHDGATGDYTIRVNGYSKVTSFWDMKIESGNRATDWTPAPEDVDSSISSVKSIADTANSLAGTANTAAGAAQTTANTALTTANNAKKNVYARYDAGGISNQYCQLADITVTAQYGDGPIKITMQSRIRGTAEICLNIESGNVNSPSFNVDDTSNYINSGQLRAWIAQDSSNAKVFHLYVDAGNWYDYLVVTDYTNSSAHTLTWVCKTVDSLPNNAQQLQRTVGMGRWCYNNDITYINGGKIYTGTVTADKINVSSLSAISANIGTVTAGTIQSNNYVKDVSGMKLSLTDGSWDSKYTKIDSDGKITCSNIGITGGSIDLTGDTGDTVLVNIKKGNTTLKLSPNGIDQRNYNGNAGASGLKSETRTMSLKNRRIEIDDTQAYSTYDIFSSAVIDIMAHADGGKTSLELHDNNGSTRVLTSSLLTSKELSFSNNKKTWTVGISGTIPELLVSCDSTKVIEINPSWSLSSSGVGVGLNADLYMTGTAAYTTNSSRGVTTQTWCGKTVQLFPYVYGNGVYRLTYGGSYMEVACDKGVGAYGVAWWESDVRLKENFTPVNFDVLDCIRDLKFKAFDWKDKSKENIHQRLGLVADEVQCIIPEAVFEVGENKIKNINTGIMSTYALKGVQDLYARIRLLEQEVINLQNQLLQKGNQNGKFY